MLFIVLFILPATIRAQKFSLGVKGGISVTSAYFPDKDIRRQFGSSPKLGYTAGGLIGFPLKKDFSFLTEVAYTQKGRRVMINESAWENNATYRFIDFSMGLRKSYVTGIIKNVKSHWFFNVGPNIEYWISGKGKIITGGPGASYTVVFDKAPDSNFNNNYLNGVNRWLFGLDLGAGFDAPITKQKRVNVELRFTWGQTFLGKKNSTSSLEILGFEDNLRSNLKTLTLTAAYTLDMDLRDAKKGRSVKDHKK